MTIKNGAAVTFAIEGGAGAAFLLIVEDGHGNTETVAEFCSEHAMALFTRALDLAKMASHAHGMNGI